MVGQSGVEQGLICCGNVGFGRQVEARFVELRFRKVWRGMIRLCRQGEDSSVVAMVGCVKAMYGKVCFGSCGKDGYGRDSRVVLGRGELRQARQVRDWCVTVRSVKVRFGRHGNERG
jgi:hypothetical protein